MGDILNAKASKPNNQDHWRLDRRYFKTQGPGDRWKAGELDGALGRQSRFERVSI
jgi:hypothetical protein